MPSVIKESIPPEIAFVTNEGGQWCLSQARIRVPLADWKSYEDFLKVYRLIVEKGVIPYALKFIGPRLVTRPNNATTAMANLQVQANTASSLPTLATAPVTESNRRDFTYILRAQLLPGQICLNVIFDSDEAYELNGVGALCAKLLLSASPTSRNIDYESCLAADRAIAAWLVNCGYERSENPHAPLAVRRRNGAVSSFQALGTNIAAGTGWCNMDTPDYRVVPNPLYDGVARVPQIGGAPPSRLRADFTNIGDLYRSPLMIAIEVAIGELARENGKNGAPIKRWFSSILPTYQQYMAEFNRHSVMFSETGFRLSDRRVDEMMAEINVLGALNESYNAIQALDIKYDSLYKYFRALPERFDPPSSLAEQINAESLISAELQRVFSAFLIMLDRLQLVRFAIGYTRAVFKMAIESTESNHFAKKIFDLCLCDSVASRMSLNTIRLMRARFDEFEAVFFAPYSQIVTDNPESFGFTFRVTKRYTELPCLTEDEYNRRRLTGFILENNNPVAPEQVVRRLTWREMEFRLRNYTFMTELRNRDVFTLLPMPIKYMEATVASLSEASPFPNVVSNVDSDERHISTREILKINSFVMKILLPGNIPSFRPDQMFLGADGLYFWTYNAPSLITAFDQRDVIARWLRPRVVNWKSYVTKFNPLSES